MDYAEQLLAPGMPPLDEIKDLKVSLEVGGATEGGGSKRRGAGGGL